MADAADAAAVSAHSSRDKAFEIFVKRTITAIQKEAWGRSKDVKEIREACQAFLNRLDQSGASDDALREVLYPLQLACASSNPKIVELALGCLHKLVAHAWLHGESGAGGSMDLLSAHGAVDGDDTVAQVIKMVIKCGESNNEALQLAVVRALLTFTTAEHFVAHGECLLAAVRAVFNLALGSEDVINKRTASNALLQMLNTIAKRVTQVQPRLGSECSGVSRTISDALETVRSTSIHSVPSGSAAGGYGLGGTASGAAPPSPTRAAPGTYPGGLPAVYEAAAAAASVLSGVNTPTEAGRAAQLASLAERSDLRGLEAALEAGGSSGGGLSEDLAGGMGPGGGTSGGGAVGPTGGESPEALATPLATPTAAASVRSSYGGVGISAGGAEGPGNGLSPMAPRSSGPGGGAGLTHAQVMRSGTDKQRLSTYERDVLLVLVAFCKLASREAGASSAESVLHQGKLLAMEMLGRVLGNPQHAWSHVSELFCRNLRQPLCLALLRNCAASDPAAYALAVRLLCAILSLPRLRLGLRAELGAFYPLLVLRPLEQESPDPSSLLAALSALKGLMSDPQLVVDLFINYDCDLQSSNLFERSVQSLSRLAQRVDPEPDKGDKNRGEAMARADALRREALQALMITLNSMEQWAAPIRESALRAAAEAEAGEAAEDGGGRSGLLHSHEGSTNSLTDRAAAAAAATSEAERFTAAKNTKDTLARGLSVFNTQSPMKGIEFIINAGLVDGTPAAIAEFLRRHADQLYKTAVGELLGHHTELGVTVMHAWVDGERYGGQSIDAALRSLLAQFRLPGEAQKIDRIMEKFAERYCKDNPGRFRNADAAYSLSFAIIMLNTDAHNPAAERRLAAADFVTMNFVQGEAGMEPALPVPELEAIYERIVSQEIVVRGEGPTAAAAGGLGASGTSNGSGARAAAAAARNRLAAAVGWTQLSRPWRALGGWDKAKGVDAERRLVLEMAEKEVARAALSGNVWHAATHAEHARPMLQVAGRWMLDALAVSYARTESPAAAEPLLQGLVQLARLAGLLGLDGLCEQAVGALASAAGVFAPAAPGTPAERQQLTALRALLALPAGPEAGLLGSSWLIVLRCASALDALHTELTRPLPPPVAAPPKDAGGGGSAFARMFGGLFGGGSSAPAPPPQQQQQQHHQQQHYGAPRDSLDGAGGHGGSSGGAGAPIRDAPGAGLAAWAASEEGRAAIARVYARSATLDGDAVVVFMRALCAVSQEELESSVAAGAAPRLHSLQKVVECAFINMGRIRLVWAKVWAVVGAQLVGASCSPHRGVALYAVDALRQLVGKLLARAELAHFSYQEDALRPFVAVLRQCDEPSVRELAVQCVMQAVATHPGGLGSGWRMVTQALRLGAADGAPAVMAQAQEALQVVVDALYRSDGGGHECLRETVQAVVAGVRNPAHLELSISAVQLLQRCGDRLAAWEDEGHREVAPAGAVANAPGGVDLDGDYGWGLLLRTLSDILQHDRRPQLGEACLDILFALLSQHSAHWDDAAWRVLLQRVLRHMLALPPGLSATDGAGGSDAGAAGLGRGAGASAAALAEQQREQQLAAVARAEEEGLVLAMLRRMDRYFPLLCEQIGLISEKYRPDLIRQLASISMIWYQHASQHLAMAGLGAMLRLATTLSALHQRQRASPAAGPSGDAGGDASWQVLLEMVATAAKDDVATVVALARQQAAAAARAAETAAGGGGGGPASAVPSRLLEGALAAGSGSPGGSPRSPAAYGARATQQQLAGSPLTPSGRLAASMGDRSRRPSAASGAGAASANSPIGNGRLGEAQLRTLRIRARQLVLLQRALGEMHSRCIGELSWDVQMRLLGIVGDTVSAAMTFNSEVAAGRYQQPGAAEPTAAGAAAAPQAGQRQSSSGSGSLVTQEQQQQQVAAALAGAGSTTSSISMAGLVEGAGAPSFSQPPSFTQQASFSASSGVSAVAPAAAFVSGGGGLGPSTQPSIEIEAADPAEGPPPPAIEVASAAAEASAATAGSSSTAAAAAPVPKADAAAAVAPAEAAAASSSLRIVTTSGGGSARGGSGGGGGSPSKRSRLPELLVTSVESSEVVGLALMRLEVEGGTQLIQGLTRSLERGGSDPTAACAARAWLLRLCREIISCEAASSTGLGLQQARAAGAFSSGGGSAAAAAADNPMRDILFGTSWEHAVRVPLVVTALDVLGGMGREDLRAEMRAVFPALARLVCSNHATLRGALAKLMASPEVLAMVAEAAGSA